MRADRVARARRQETNKDENYYSLALSFSAASKKAEQLEDLRKERQIGNLSEADKKEKEESARGETHISRAHAQPLGIYYIPIEKHTYRGARGE